MNRDELDAIRGRWSLINASTWPGVDVVALIKEAERAAAAEEQKSESARRVCDALTEVEHYRRLYDAAGAVHDLTRAVVEAADRLRAEAAWHLKRLPDSIGHTNAILQRRVDEYDAARSALPARAGA